jgi:hypothetical protein
MNDVGTFGPDRRRPDRAQWAVPTPARSGTPFPQAAAQTTDGKRLTSPSPGVPNEGNNPKQPTLEARRASTPRHRHP